MEDSVYDMVRPQILKSIDASNGTKESVRHLRKAAAMVARAAEWLCPAALAPSKRGIQVAYGPDLKGHPEDEIFIFATSKKWLALQVDPRNPPARPDDEMLELLNSTEVRSGIWAEIHRFTEERSHKAFLLLDALMYKDSEGKVARQEWVKRTALAGFTPVTWCISINLKKQNRAGGLIGMAVLPPSIDLTLADEHHA